MSKYDHIHDLPTPSLLLNWPAAKHNIDLAAAFVADKTARLRPHFKNHKCSALALRQIAGGNCVGITAANVTEATALVDAGVEDVLIANQVVGAANVSRLIELAQRAQVRAAVDGLGNAGPISQAAVAAGIKVGVLLEVDIGMARSGVAPGEPALQAAKQLGKLPGVSFDGIQSYEGHAIGIIDHDERSEVTRRSLQLSIDTRRLLEANDIPVKILSGAGTGTYHVSAELPGVDELQIGSYVTMDWTYSNRVAHAFKQALSVLVTAISVQGDRFVLDVGLKGIGSDFGPPKVKDHPEFEVPNSLSEEHTTITAPGHNVKVGDRLEMIPSHCCTTCFRYRQMVVHDQGSITDIWPIDGAGYALA
jgi:D-serine deaminase-like pyridoxal phosphate-dependent protein